ncbi:MAG: CotH kinase family protein [Clostridium sp.]|nr:CotH kinase family protein [Clostridium sp.]
MLCNVFDDAYIRNKITYDMAIAAGLAASSESYYMDLYVNGKYHGLYQLTEKIEIDEERVDIANLDKKNEAVNRGNYDVNKLDGAYTDMSSAVYLPNVPSDITGGYLVERDYGVKFQEVISGFQTHTLHNCYSIINPELASAEEMQYISTLFEEMEAAIVAEDGINPDTGKSYIDYIDLTSFADKYIIEELSKNEGGGMSSAFYYKPEDAVSKKVFAGPVWDYDKAYARDINIDNNPRNLCYLTLKVASSEMYWYLYQQPKFQEKVKEEYSKFFSDYLESLINEKIDVYAEEIRQSAEMDQIRWETTYKNRGAIHTDYQVNIGSIKNFLRERKSFLDKVWLEDAEICNIQFVDDYQNRNNWIGVIKGESLGTIQANESPTAIFVGWFHKDTLEELNLAEPVMEDAVYKAKWKIIENEQEE